MFTSALYKKENRWRFGVVAPILGGDRSAAAEPTPGEVDLHAAIFHRALLRGFIHVSSSSDAHPQAALEKIGFSVNTAKKFATGGTLANTPVTGRVFADHPPGVLQLEKHFDEMVNSLRKLKKLITDEPTQHHVVAVGVHALVADHPIPPEAAVVAALTMKQDVPPDPQSTPLAEHVTATAATFLSTVHKSAYPDSPAPDVHIEVSSSENEQASADGLVRDETLWLDLWLPTYRDPLDPKYGEDADWRRWQQPDDPPVLDILARHDDGRPDTVLALRALPEDSGLMVVDADAIVDWSGSSPVIRWARTDDRDETAWQVARTHRGRAAADTEHPPVAA